MTGYGHEVNFKNPAFGVFRDLVFLCCRCKRTTAHHVEIQPPLAFLFFFLLFFFLRLFSVVHDIQDPCLTRLDAFVFVTPRHTADSSSVRRKANTRFYAPLNGSLGLSTIT